MFENTLEGFTARSALCGVRLCVKLVEMKRRNETRLLALLLLVAAAGGCQLSGSEDASDTSDVSQEADTIDEDLVVEEDAADISWDPDIFDQDMLLDDDVDLPLDEGAEDAHDATELPPGLVWVSIPGGSFQMGCSPGDEFCTSYENPTHLVNIAAFWMTETEVTQGQYQYVTGENPSYHPECHDCPVEQVNWYQAKAFCEAIGGRLPSEAEWEYAARGGTTTAWTCGDATSSCLGDIAWYDDNSGGSSHKVKGKGVNGFGLYDMIGNVWEWVEDCWHDDYTGAPSTGIVWTDGADCNYRVSRGGAVRYYERQMRVSKRERPGRGPDDWDWYGGLRCAH